MGLDNLWAKIRSVVSLIDALNRILWWYEWGVVLALFICITALSLTLWALLESQRKAAMLPLVGAALGFPLVIPSFLVRLDPVLLLRLSGYEGWFGAFELVVNPDKIGEVFSKLEMLTYMAWLGAFIAGASIFVSLVGWPLGWWRRAGRYCPVCGSQLEPSWLYCPYCPPSEVQVASSTSNRPAQPIKLRSSPSAQLAPIHEGEPIPRAAVRGGPSAPTKLQSLRSSPQAWLVLKSGPEAGKRYPLQGITTVGRDRSRNIIAVDDPTVSAKHAKIRLDKGQFVLYDLGTTNGTAVNGRRVTHQPLRDGDTIQMGKTVFTFQEVLDTRG